MVTLLAWWVLHNTSAWWTRYYMRKVCIFAVGVFIFPFLENEKWCFMSPQAQFPNWTFKKSLVVPWMVRFVGHLSNFRATLKFCATCPKKVVYFSLVSNTKFRGDFFQYKAGIDQNQIFSAGFQPWNGQFFLCIFNMKFEYNKLPFLGMWQGNLGWPKNRTGGPQIGQLTVLT